MMDVILLAVIAVLAAALILLYRKTRNTVSRIDKMIDTAYTGTFCEQRFDETQLSRLETRMHRYLSSGITARGQIAAEKDAIKTLISDISHQTKTPISNILLYTQLLCEREDLPKEARELAVQIERQTEKLQFLVQALIKTSRLENGVITVVPQENQIDKLIEELEGQYKTAAADKKIRLCAGRNPELSARFDFKWTQEALANILDNGIKYSPEGGTIEITAQAYDLFIRIDIKDQGIGISEEETARIFSRFYRAPQVADQPGVGIGLYLAREIITMQGGYIKVSSEPGKGSVFSVFLPRQQNLSQL